jgi:amino acid adenylation domain-containing protein
LAHWLQGQGVQPDDLVALVAPKGWEQVAGALGIVKSGAAYLPIDHDQPPARMRQILADAGVRCVVTTADVIGTVDWPQGLATLALDEQALAGQPCTLPANPAQPGHLAYVIYTSGSTGKPKGCAIEHGAALNTLVDINQRFHVTDRDVLCAISAMGFDLSVYDVFGGLGAGATLVMPASQLPNPSEWLQLCREHGVTVWNSVPALAEMLATHAEETGQLVPATLRLALLSGDWIPLSLPPLLAAANPGMEIVSLGGATEASIWSIYHPVNELSPDWSSVPYGRPLANQTIHVLNAWLEDCPLWATGDLYIGGVGLARGYHGDPERTAASFIVHPRTGERLYRTGDMGRMRPEGVVEFLGRADTQVKIRGYRIELGEVEDAIAKTGLAEHAVAITTGDTHATRQLLAFVMPRAPVDSPEAFTTKLAEALAGALPKYMIPAVFVHLEELPLTANGKVDRKKLAAMGSDLRAKVEYVAPRNDTEQRIAKLWQELLGVEKVGVHDDFFSLGGNSLIASRLLVKIHDIFEIEVPFAKLFDAANVAALSALVIEQVLADIEAELEIAGDA